MAKLKAKWELDQAVKAAKKTLRALDKYGTELEPRLPGGITEGLKNDLAFLTGAKITRPALVKTAKAKTRGEREFAKDGADLLSRLRQALKVCPQSTPEILKAVGVGSQVSPSKTASVASSLSALLDASKTYVETFRAAGILDSDLAEARDILQNLLSADEAQQEVQGTGQDMTAQKDAAQLRLEQAVATIAAAGQMQYRKEAAKRAVFENLAPRTANNRVKEPETQPAPAP